MSQMFFTFNIESLSNRWSFTVTETANEYGDIVYQVRGRLNENGQEMLFNLETKHIDAILDKIRNILECEQMFVYDE